MKDENVINSQYVFALVEDMVKDVRNELSRMYDVITGIHSDYADLCDLACSTLKRRIINNKEKFKTDLKVVIFHGEQKHTSRIDPIFWCYEHTWLGIHLSSDIMIYIDPTSQQFRLLYDEIPDYYISLIPPPWYILDSDNIFTQIYKFNKWFAIKIYDRIEYYVWGGICKIIRKILKREGMMIL